MLLAELGLYAVLVTGYLWVVLLLIDHWVVALAAQPGLAYAIVAVGLIVGQGFLLDIVVDTLLRFVRFLLGRS